MTKFHTNDYLLNLNTMEYRIIKDSGLNVSYLGVAKLQEASPAESPVTSGVPHSTVLEPCLFLLYINGIADSISSTVCLFADNCVIYRPINYASDQ